MDENLTEVVKFVKVLQDAGVKLICATIGSPYYNVHMQRPAYYPVCDGYLPMEDPLYNVSRHINAVAKLKQLCPEIAIVGSGYTALQEFFPHAATYALENNLADFIGLGRMMISYPEIFSDILEGKELNRRLICRTFGDCTNAPRNGLVSGCYPLDHFYKEMPECACLKAIKEKNKKA
jgi:2,4-dienoyl-CoA reductase-like NADH-dependent reductase (Old Yellow Enzyme family)